MKFVADEGVDGSLVRLLREAGYQVIWYVETDHSTADSDILKVANAENAILITRDKDFGELVFRLRMVHSGIILVRAEELKSAHRSQLVFDFIEKNWALLARHFIVIQPGSSRARAMTD